MKSVLWAAWGTLMMLIGLIAVFGFALAAGPSDGWSFANNGINTIFGLVAMGLGGFMFWKAANRNRRPPRSDR